jgi:hypothetical protein
MWHVWETGAFMQGGGGGGGGGSGQET